jgi:hypothetical protein
MLVMTENKTTPGRWANVCTALLLLLVALTATPSQAQDVSLLAGRMSVTGQGQASFGTNLSYTHRVGDYVAISANYLNEGHPPLHHRDGFASQLWLHTGVPEQGWSVAAGFGPYFYFDTTRGSALDYRNVHGWGTAGSLSVKYHLQKGWYLEAQATRINTRNDHDSKLLLIGMGYELTDIPFDTTRQNVAKGDDFITVSVGRAIVNSFESEQSRAKAIEYRRNAGPHAEWSVMLLDEGRVHQASRKGVVAQAWLVSTITSRFVLEMGVGGYAMTDHHDRTSTTEEASFHLVPIASIGLRYRISPHLRAQVNWTRTITPYHRDSDVLLFGVGAAY